MDSGWSTPTELSVSPGPHVVKIVNEERGFTREQAVEIGAGEEKALQVDGAEPAAPGKVPAFPVHSSDQGDGE